MATQTTISTRLAADRVWRGSGWVRSVVLVLAASLVLTLSAKIEVPFWPVPVTMQSLAVLMIGLAYGSRLGAAAVLAYLAEGAAGLPVFAGAAAGPAYLAGPTGGYLIGFALAAFCVGWMVERGWVRGAAGATLALTVGHVVLFVPGTIWLAALLGWPKGIALGVTPFIFGTVVKTALGVALVAAFQSFFTRRPAGS